MGAFILLTPGFPENEQDSTCLPAFQQFALSVKSCFPSKNFIIISFHYPFFKKEYQWHGIPVISLGGSNKPGLRRAYTWIQAYACLRRLKKTQGIEGILSLWLTECSLVAKYFSNLHGIKYYMWLIGQDAKVTNQYIKRIQPSGENIIAMSDFLKDEFLKNHHQKAFAVVENGINPETFPPFNGSNRPIDILGVGSLIALKNYSLFIDIIAEVQKVHADIQALIAGTGEEEDLLKEKVKHLGLEKNIRFAGQVEHSQILNLMAQAKLFLHTSHYEGNSTVLMEALYSGCFTYSTQPLSHKQTDHLTVLKSQEEFTEALLLFFRTEIHDHKSVCFNTMNHSAKKIMSLFIE